MPELHRLLQKQMTQPKGPLAGRFFQTARSGSSKTKARQAVPMSLRLMTVGNTIENAKPAIVIFTQGEESSSFERLLKQPLLRQLYQPDDSITPSFEVVVVGDPARKRRHLDEISAVFDSDLARHLSSVTYCGARIRLEAGGEGPTPTSVIATLGGVIKLNFEIGDFMLVGMTAGHVLEDLYLDDSDSEDGEDDAAQEFPFDYLGQSSRQVVGDLLYPPLEVNSHIHTTGEQNDSYPESDDESQLASRPAIPPRDWALFGMNNGLKIKPNIIPMQSGPGQYRLHPDHRRHMGRCPRENCMSTAPSESFPSIQPIEVVMISNIAGNTQNSILYGELSHVPASIMLSIPDDNDGEFLIEAYMLTLDEKADNDDHNPNPVLGEIQDGHSGAWVVNPISMEVYGHVVATDLTGDAYVIPLHATFDEMKRTMPGVEAVGLPTTADLLDLALRNSGPTTAAIRRRSTASSGDGAGAMAVRTTASKSQLSPKAHHIEPTFTSDRDRRTSELLALCENREGSSNSDSDSDSGYGSADTMTTPLKAMLAGLYDAEEHEEAVVMESKSEVEYPKRRRGRRVSRDDVEESMLAFRQCRRN